MKLISKLAVMAMFLGGCEGVNLKDLEINGKNV